MLQYASLQVPSPVSDNSSEALIKLEWFPLDRERKNWRVAFQNGAPIYDAYVASKNPFESIVPGEVLLIPFGLKVMGLELGCEVGSITLSIVVGAEELLPKEYKICFDEKFLRKFEKIRQELILLENWEHSPYCAYSREKQETDRKIINLKSELRDLIASKNLKKN